MMVNNNLVGGFNHLAILVNGKDDIPYIMENKIHVWNHQSVIVYGGLVRITKFILYKIHLNHKRMVV